jgi:hypothetical protein
MVSHLGLSPHILPPSVKAVLQPVIERKYHLRRMSQEDQVKQTQEPHRIQT